MYCCLIQPLPLLEPAFVQTATLIKARSQQKRQIDKEGESVNSLFRKINSRKPNYYNTFINPENTHDDVLMYQNIIIIRSDPYPQLKTTEAKHTAAKHKHTHFLHNQI